MDCNPRGHPDTKEYTNKQAHGERQRPLWEDVGNRWKRQLDVDLKASPLNYQLTTQQKQNDLNHHMLPDLTDQSRCHWHRSHQHQAPNQRQWEDKSLCGILTKTACPESPLEKTLHKPKQGTFNKLNDLESLKTSKSRKTALAGVAQQLSAGLQIKGSLVRFPVGAHAWVAGQVPSRGCARGDHTLMFLSISFSLPSPL